jgi:steroid 5-alpha reductase family enzyme
MGFVVESVADWELRIFKKDPLSKGQTLMGGLWAMCRHPNYLGEILIWWGFGLFSLGSSSGFWGLLSPLLMTFLLLRVSGVPMLENRMRSSSADFVRYIETTPAVFPVKVTHLIVFAAVACSLMVLDFLWLGIFLGDFYRTAAKDLARLNGSEWDVLLWPAAGVYFFLALAIQQFAITDKAPQTVYRGFMLGLCIYGVYDLTNLALLRNWPVSMALVDMAWGPILCACGAAVGFWLQRRWLSRA